MDVAYKLGISRQECPEWLIISPKHKLPQSERLAFTPLKRDKDGNFITPNSSNDNSKNSMNSNQENSFRKRAYGQFETQSTSLNRRALVAPMINKQPTAQELALRTNGSSTDNTNGRVRMTKYSANGKSKIIWSDVPDDIFFRRADATRYV